MKKSIPVGTYVRENVLNPPVSVKLNANFENVLEDVLVLKYSFKEGSIFNTVLKLDGTEVEVPNLWLIFDKDKNTVDIPSEAE